MYLRLAAISLLLCLLSFWKPALAEPLLPTNASARQHLKLGNKLYNLRSFNEAAAEYKAGALLDPAPVFDYNLGQCFRNIGRYEDAIWHYERFLERGSPDGLVLENVQNFIVQMKSELAHKAKTGESLVPQPSGPKTGDPSTTSSRISLVPMPPSQRRWYHDPIGWGVTGAGSVAVGIGIALLVNASDLRGMANDTRLQTTYKQFRDDARLRTTAGFVVGGIGTALLATGIVKLVLVPATNTKSAWRIDFTGAQVALSGGF